MLPVSQPGIPVRTILVLLVFLLLTASLAALQIFLSRRESRWPGLVLPGLSLLWSLIYVLSAAAGPGNAAFGILAAVFLTANIPTLLLLAIYFACRARFRRRREMDRMNAQDLE